MGHTNFDITNRIKETLDSIEGIEILKICSRYRFFIGVGQMFNFSEVRKSIENEFINKKEMQNDRGKN
jgi:dimeric dUTPase (all-alpha-NTP-PPase superfamily)